MFPRQVSSKLRVTAGNHPIRSDSGLTPASLIILSLVLLLVLLPPEIRGESMAGCALLIALLALLRRSDGGATPTGDAVAVAIVAAAVDGAAQAALTDGIRKNFEERDIFGVPTLILPRGSRFWGHDRIEWALREGLILA